MNKSTMMENIHHQLRDQGYKELSRQDVIMAVGLILDHCAQALAERERIEIRDFGVFTLHIIAARAGRNPKTGKSVDVPEKRNVHFKPGTAMRVQVNQNKRSF
ncbi:HU family DNA-binding protein [Acidithiobacillus sulfurivorans]|uniref:Integration host factor subunit beta n=1 Tax=Acidithiobacillus sulfurivorans TaxID=1958756 RepID=A0ABS5ZX15_9PROT|nr:HU family DNA-binding protein [Acidithiobacillus sulfurivorans]MBU2759575.1 integration host factor subunit beta [Acidithiobacillus sulfurivorans]